MPSETESTTTGQLIGPFGKVRYHERLSMSAEVKSIVVSVAIGVAIIPFVLPRGPWTELVLPMLFGIAMFGLVLLIAGYGEFRHLRVDDAGLHIARGKFVPAHEIGEAIVVSKEEAEYWGWWPNCHGVPLHWMYTIPRRPEGPLVLLVRDRPGLRRPGMILRSRNPEALAAALNQLRRDARGETHVQHPEYFPRQKTRRRRRPNTESRAYRRRMRRKARAFHDPPGGRGGRARS